MSDAKIEEAKAALRLAAHKKRAAFHPSLRSEAAKAAAGHFFDSVPIA
jgi:5-formyltetrahydrofolate cyclo-ligase